MAKKKTTRRRKNSLTIPVAMALPITQQVIETANDIDKNGWEHGINWLVGRLTGYYHQENYPDWRFRHFKKGGLPILVGFGVHKVASMLGINRAIARAGIPFIRI